jgi:endonuclease/exonuclease/phosphatase family metal-dependent hydrolase
MILGLQLPLHVTTSYSQTVPDLTVVTLNLFGHEDRWYQRAALVAQQLLALAPDLAALQEVSLAIDQANWLVAWLNAECGSELYRTYFVPYQGGIAGAPAAANAIGIITKHPVTELEGLTFVPDAHVAQFVRLALADGQSLAVYNTNLYGGATREAGRLRGEQSERLLHWIAAHGDATRPRLLLGDFNAVPASRAIGTVKQQFRSAYEVFAGQEPAATWPTPLAGPSDMKGTLDYIFVSPGIEVLEARLVFDEPAADNPLLYPSDHWGLMARLRLP